MAFTRHFPSSKATTADLSRVFFVCKLSKLDKLSKLSKLGKLSKLNTDQTDQTGTTKVFDNDHDIAIAIVAR